MSVVMPAHNTAGYIGAALDSVRAQSLPDWEAIVVDDGSQDATGHVAAYHAACDPRVRVVTGERRSGVSAARNTALARARGEWVLFLDADDVLEPGALTCLVRAGEAAGLDGAFGAYHVCGQDLSTLYTYTDARETVGLDDLFDRAYLWTGAHIIRRACLEKNERGARAIRFDPGLTGYEDRDVWLRLAERGVRWACTPEPVSRYRIRPASASKDPGAMVRDAHRVVRACHERQAAMPADDRLLDVDDQRLRAALNHLALAYASRAAVLGDPRRAAALWDEFGPSDRTQADFGASPADAARAGQYAVVYGLGRWPDPLGREEPAWASSLFEWWQSAGPAFLDEATSALRATLEPGRKPGAKGDRVPMRAAG